MFNNLIVVCSLVAYIDYVLVCDIFQTFREDIDAHREIMQNLDRTGTYLKYFGRKQDTVYIKNLLISIKLRWKKLVRRAEEKGRLLQQALKEDKRVSARRCCTSRGGVGDA